MKLNLTVPEQKLAADLYKPIIKGDTLEEYGEELSIFSCSLTDLCEFNQDYSATGADNIMSKEEQVNLYIKVMKELRRVNQVLIRKTTMTTLSTEQQ